jgi:hypothetical protein
VNDVFDDACEQRLDRLFYRHILANDQISAIVERKTGIIYLIIGVALFMPFR